VVERIAFMPIDDAASCVVDWWTLLFGHRMFGICFLFVDQSSQDQWQHCCTMAWLGEQRIVKEH
jgi:hypothetical protein